MKRPAQIRRMALLPGINGQKWGDYQPRERAGPPQRVGSRSSHRSESLLVLFLVLILITVLDLGVRIEVLQAQLKGRVEFFLVDADALPTDDSLGVDHVDGRPAADVPVVGDRAVG